MLSNLHRLSNVSSQSTAGQGPAPSHDRPNSRASSSSHNVQAVLLVLAHCLGLVCSVLTIVWVLRFRGGLPLVSHNPQIADNNDLLFNVHPVLMLPGYIVLTSEAILVFKGVGGTKSGRKAVHLVIQGLALMLSLFGVWAALKHHNAKGIDNFYSLHSWLGVATITIFILQWVVGYSIFWYPGGSGKTRMAMLPWHVVMGLAVYCLALVTAEMGLLEKLTFMMGSKVIGRYSLEAIFVNSLGLLLICYGAVVVLIIVMPKGHKEAVRNLD